MIQRLNDRLRTLPEERAEAYREWQRVTAAAERRATQRRLLLLLLRAAMT